MKKFLSLAILLSLAAVPAEAASLSACVAGLKAQAIRAGISPALVDTALSNVAFDEKAVRFSRSQPEYVTPIWDYMAFLVDQDRIGTGARLLKAHAKTLHAVEKAYGVDRHIVTALWGIESNYGQSRGDFHIPHALANVVCAGKKPKYFSGELIEALGLVARGDVKLGDLNGSWAGAFGQTQFMPSTYRRLAVDFDRDGKRDLVNSVPDALASTANYLDKAGWRNGEPTVLEVRLPKSYNGPSGRKKKASLSSWAKRGIKRADGKPLGGGLKAGLLLPAGKSGPAFLVFANFDALYTYNVAESYALAIAHLADRLRGDGPIAARWPTDDPGLSRAERLELQRRLLKHGYDIGEADGRIGPITTEAIKRAEAKFGMKPSGRPGRRIFDALGTK